MQHKVHLLTTDEKVAFTVYICMCKREWRRAEETLAEYNWLLNTANRAKYTSSI